MAWIIPLAAQELLLEPLTRLRVGPNCANSREIHKWNFVGEVTAWKSFGQDVAALSSSTRWSNRTIDTYC